MRTCSQQLLGVLITLIVGLGCSGQAMAEDHAVPHTICPICKQANDQASNYSTNASHTLARGAANTILGWTEVIRQPAEEVKEGGNVFTGILRGVGKGVKRTLAGAGEVLTFWTPKTSRGYVHFAHDCPLCMGKKP